MIQYGHYLYLITYLLNYLPHAAASFLEKDSRFAVSREIPPILWYPKVHSRSHKCPPTVPILSQLDPVHNPKSHFLKIHLNIILHLCLRLPCRLLHSGFPHRNPVHASHLPHTCNMPRPSHSSRFYHPNSIE